MAPSTEPTASRRHGRVLGAIAVSAVLHAAAAAALVAVQDRASTAGNLPAPQALVVTMVTSADLVPDTPPAAIAMPEANLASAIETDAEPVAPSEGESGPTAPVAPAFVSDLPAEIAPVADLTAAVALELGSPLPRPKPRPAAPEPVAKADATAVKPKTAAKKSDGAESSAAAAPTGKAAGEAAAAGPSKAEIADLKAEWGGQVRGRIERKKAYPAAAKGVAGTVKVRLTVARSGKLVAVALAGSSGNAALDAAAIKAVKAAGRFPAAPKALAEDSYSFTLPMRFQP